MNTQPSACTVREISSSTSSAVSTIGLPESSLTTGAWPMFERMMLTASSLVCLVAISLLRKWGVQRPRRARGFN
uniref:Gp25 n=1 Tax=uncultured marine virus TaxID=186617 RepID=A0A0F7L893_9VIRU|nr:gp25 [uncultured marine virus]